MSSNVGPSVVWFRTKRPVFSPRPDDPPRVAAFSRQREAERALRESLSPIVPECSCDWVAFERLARGADCAVAVVPWLDEPGALTRLGGFPSRVPGTPLVLITSGDLENVRRAAGLDLLDQGLAVDHARARHGGAGSSPAAATRR